MNLSPNEMAEIIGTMSNAASSMESQYGKELTISLARKLHERCLSEGIEIFPYNEEEYLGKTYRIKPDDKYIWGYWHDGWTAGDPGYESIKYTEYDAGFLAETEHPDEIKLDILNGIKDIRLDEGRIIIEAPRVICGKKYLYRFVYSNGSEMEGPFDENWNKVETDRRRFMDNSVKDLFVMFMRTLNCLPANFSAVRAVYAAREEEILRLTPIVDELRRERTRLQMLNMYQEYMNSKNAG